MALREVNPQEAIKTFVAKYPTQRDAAKALGVHESYVCDLLKGRREFSEMILSKLGLRWTVVR